jgi:phosphoenolpyruvate-protein phosphotransferase
MTQDDPNVIHPGRDPTTYIGAAISPGVGMGPAWLVVDLLKSAPDPAAIAREEIAGEWSRIQTSFEQARRELEDSALRIEEQFDAGLAGIFRAHGMMLDGILSSGEIERELESLIDAEAAVRRVFRRRRERFMALKGHTLQQRADDVADLGRRVLRHLRGLDESSLEHVPAGNVLVVERLLPSDVVPLSRRGVAAIVVGALASGAHAALLAREKRIPVVAGPPGIVHRIRNLEELLVDGSRGTIVVSPDAETRRTFQARVEAFDRALVRCRGACREPAFTLDRELVSVEANLGAHDDIALAIDNGADGVGLFRIEQLYLARVLPPSEDELFEELRAVTAPLRGRPVTIRLLDIGGDKPVPFLPFPVEPNPSLGRRGVRLLLEYPELVQTQLAALFRLAQEQDVRILVPMVTLEEDIREMRLLFDATLETFPGAKRPPFGAMIETPAAALGVATIARHVDFLSVGTNDLAQYTLAAGRDDPAVSHYYDDTHAAVLRLLAIAITDAPGVPIAVCGELAGREAAMPQLLRLGFRSLSMAPGLIPAAKELIRGVRLGETASPPSAARSMAARTGLPNAAS